MAERSRLPEDRMKKLLALVALIASTFAAVPAPTAEAIIYCSSGYCANRPDTDPCDCPPWSDRYGETAFCSDWDGISGCWYE